MASTVSHREHLEHQQAQLSTPRHLKHQQALSTPETPRAPASTVTPRHLKHQQVLSTPETPKTPASTVYRVNTLEAATAVYAVDIPEHKITVMAHYTSKAKITVWHC